MRSKILFFLSIIIIVLSANYLIEDNGYVLIELLSYSIETSIPIFLLLLSAAYLLLRLVSLVWNSPRYLKDRLRKKRAIKVNKKMHEAMKLIGEGNFIKAERVLRSFKSKEEISIDLYLTGFRAAHNTGDETLRSDWLTKLLETSENLESYINIIDAELRMATKEYDKAKDILENILASDPENKQALRLINLIYSKISDHESMIVYSKAMLEHGYLSDPLKENIINSFQAILSGHLNDSELFENQWLMVPKNLRKHPNLLVCKYKSMMKNNKHEHTEKELRKIIPKTWSANLLSIYGQLNSPDLVTLSKRVDLWLQERPRDSNLWLLSSRLAKRDGLWTKAQQCIVRSIDYYPSAIKYSELGLIYIELGQKDDALEAFNKALALMQ